MTFGQVSRPTTSRKIPRNSGDSWSCSDISAHPQRAFTSGREAIRGFCPRSRHARPRLAGVASRRGSITHRCRNTVVWKLKDYVKRTHKLNTAVQLQAFMEEKVGVK